MLSVFTDFWIIELRVKIVDYNFLKCGNFNSLVPNMFYSHYGSILHFIP